MRNSLDYAGLAQLCVRSPIMRKIMRAHNRIIQPSLLLTYIKQMCQSAEVNLSGYRVTLCWKWRQLCRRETTTKFLHITSSQAQVWSKSCWKEISIILELYAVVDCLAVSWRVNWFLMLPHLWHYFEFYRISIVLWHCFLGIFILLWYLLCIFISQAQNCSLTVMYWGTAYLNCLYELISNIAVLL